jgi:thiamine monophosphate kinase
MDISDGLARDLPRLLRAARVAAEVDGALLPAPGAELLRATGHAEPSAVTAWLGGEDYALVVTGPADLPARAQGVELVRIGRVVAGPPGALALRGPLAGVDGGGFDHFA